MKDTSGKVILDRLKAALKENEDKVKSLKGEFKTNLRLNLNNIKYIINSMQSINGGTIEEILASFEVQFEKIVNLAIIVKNQVVSIEEVIKDFGADDTLLISMQSYYEDLIIASKILRANKMIEILKLDIKVTENELLNEKDKKEMLAKDILERLKDC